MRVSPRIAAICRNVAPCAVAADIGCDHGYIARELLACGKAGRVIAGDISAPSLAKCAALGLENIETRQGDGLFVLGAGEAEQIVIAGMGGLLIANIVRRGLHVLAGARLVLCPHTHAADLRQALYQTGFEITQEDLAQEDGRFYEIVCARFADKPQAVPAPAYLEVGMGLEAHPLFGAFVHRKIRSLEQIIEKIGNRQCPRSLACAELIAGIKERLP